MEPGPGWWWADRELDAALLKMENGDYPTLPLRPLSQPTQTGESIYHWGYPFGGKLSDDLNELQPSLFQGYISSTQIKNGLELHQHQHGGQKGLFRRPVFSKKVLAPSSASSAAPRPPGMSTF